MRALVYSEGELSYETEYPQPELNQHDALIRVILAGICGTDHEIMHGYKKGFKGILGHEFVGIVEQVGDTSNSQWIGKRVVGEINITCRQCELCLRRDTKVHCYARKALGIVGKDGTFADYITLPVCNLFIVPDDIEDEEAVFVEPLAAALQIMERSHIHPTHNLAVVGDGRLGLLVTQVICLTGANVTLLGRHPDRVNLLKQGSIYRNPQEHKVTTSATKTFI